MLNLITRSFTSLFAFLTAPFRAIWRGIVRWFPERDFTIMDTPTGNVYSFHQGSFWRFTKFVGKITLVVWASWSTYVFVYHRPLLQRRTQQLEEQKVLHAEQIGDILAYLDKYGELVGGLNVIDDTILNSKKLSDAEKDNLMKRRLATWGEMDFIHTALETRFSDTEYVPEFRNMSSLTVEYNIVRAENETLKSQNEKMIADSLRIADADNQIVDLVTKLSSENTDALRENMSKINGTIAGFGLSVGELAERANKFESNLVGSAFVPLNMGDELDPKYQKLADSLELWHGLARLDKILPLGAPVTSPRVTSNFGTRADPFTDKPTMHKGIDFAGKIGTELYAIAPGRVVSAGERVGYGKTVELDHGLGFSTLYAHMSAINVTRGDWVRPGNVVGLGGNTGRSTGPHLHYEIRYNGAPFNPANFVKEDKK